MISEGEAKECHSRSLSELKPQRATLGSVDDNLLVPHAAYTVLENLKPLELCVDFEPKGPAQAPFSRGSQHAITVNAGLD